MKRGRKRKTEAQLRELLLEKVQPEPNSGCWLWMGGVTGSGYGKTGAFGQKQIMSHRLAYLLFVGPIPNGMYVCHKCDVKICVNPDHLFVGTQKDNFADFKSKGRSKAKGGQQGEIHHKAKLTNKAVLDIREQLKNKVEAKALAEQYGVSASTIGAISRNEGWTHVR